MTSCKNCSSPVDEKEQIHCTTCNATLHKECAIKEDGNFYCDVCYTVKGEEKQEYNVEVPEVIRRSYIELYRTCPYAFYLNVIKGLDTTISSYAQIGIDLHTLFERTSAGLLVGEDILIKEFDKYWETYKDEMFEADLHLYRDMDISTLRKKLKQQSYDAISTYYNVVLPTLPKQAFAVERTIQFSVGDDIPKVSMTMDRIDEIDGELEVSDWKTGNVMVGQKLSTDLQAPLYIYGIREEYKKPVRRFTLYYLSENKTRTYERVDDDNYVCIVGKREYKINLTDAIREVQHVFSQIKKGQFNIPRDTRSMYFACKTCTFQKIKRCEGADIESWKQH